MLLFLVLRAITKSKVKLIVIVFKNKKKQQQFIKKRGKKLIQEIKEKRLRAITLQGAIGKIAMFLLGKWKN